MVWQISYNDEGKKGKRVRSKTAYKRKAEAINAAEHFNQSKKKLNARVVKAKSDSFDTVQ